MRDSNERLLRRWLVVDRLPRLGHSLIERPLRAEPEDKAAPREFERDIETEIDRWIGSAVSRARGSSSANSVGASMKMAQIRMFIS
jgi:hypothetical protein